jgi:hypothetical protein
MPVQACHQLLSKAFQMLKRFGYWLTLGICWDLTV